MNTIKKKNTLSLIVLLILTLIISTNSFAQEKNKYLFNNANKVDCIMNGEAGVYLIEVQADNLREVLKVILE